MAFDEGLAQRVREVLDGRADVIEKRMFGGLCFMVSGHMCCGVLDDTLMARVGPDACDACPAEPHAREMDFTGRPLRGMIYVAPPGIESDADLGSRVERCLAFVATLAPRA